MLVRLKSSPKQDAGPLAALAGDRVTSSDFRIGDQAAQPNNLLG
jgi:hypothetical protein